MEVVFGSSLDGLSYPENVGGSLASLNSLVAGPLSLLGLLEARFGLRCPPHNRTLRLAEYLRVLQSVEGPHFFKASLANDPWSTADHLLTLRDELVASGWKRQNIDGFPRLASFAEVEKSGSISDGFGERLQRLIAHLQTVSRSPVDRILLVEPLASLPFMWQKVVELLQRAGASIEELPLQAKAKSKNSDLHLLQQLLLSPAAIANPRFSGDGSLAVLDADDELQTAVFTAYWLSRQDNCAGTVLIRGSDCSLLTQSCERFSLPGLGNTARSQLKSSYQILPLAFKLVCRPLDPVNLVEFLCVDDGPIPARLASKLLKVLSRTPGIDGEAWQHAWANELADLCSKLLRDDRYISKDEAAKQAEDKIREYREWFVQQVSPADLQIGKISAEQICRRVEKWALSRAAGAAAGSEAATTYGIAAVHARMLQRLVDIEGGDKISLIQMYKMIDSVLSYGVSLTAAEAASWSLVDKPGQIWDSAETVVWWGFAQANWSFPRRPVWAEPEIAELLKHGIHIEKLAAKLRRESYSWRLPIINAAERLLLLKPRVVAGERAVAHPVWDEISCNLSEASAKAIVLPAAKIYAMEKLQFSGTELICTRQKKITLPGQLRTWQLPAGQVKARREESYSSLEKLLACPLAWVLQYCGRMYQSSHLELPQKQMLLGNLAHAVVNEMFREKKRWFALEAKQFAALAVERLLPQMAASLLLPGAKPQLREASETIPDAVFQLVKFLSDADARVEDSELKLSAPLLEQTKLSGTVDLLLRLPSGGRAVIDFKWSSAPYWFRKRIVEGKALQLAIYSWLAQQTDAASVAPRDSKSKTSNVLLGNFSKSKMPPAGYFMFRHAELFFTSEGIFPDYTLVRRMERDLDETWQLIFEAYKRRFEEVRSGRVIATGIINDTIELEAFMHAQLADPPCNFCKLGHFCGNKELT